MNRDSNPRSGYSQMQGLQKQRSEQEELDRSLSRVFDCETAKDSLLPSSGFASHVMGSILENAAVPPPLRFPWKRALPSFGGAVLLLLYAFIGFITRLPRLSGADHPETTLHLPVSIGNVAIPLGWSALALLAAFVCVRLCLRLAAPRA